MVAAYVMATEGYSFKETMTLIKRVRPAAQPNAGFVAQLVAFEKHLEKARAEGRLLGRVQLEGEIENEHDLSGINHLASVAVDVAACLESDTSSVDSESPRGEEGELVAEKNPAGAERQVLTKETGTDARASKRTPSSPTGGGRKRILDALCHWGDSLDLGSVLATLFVPVRAQGVTCNRNMHNAKNRKCRFVSDRRRNRSGLSPNWAPSFPRRAGLSNVTFETARSGQAVWRGGPGLCAAGVWRRPLPARVLL